MIKEKTFSAEQMAMVLNHAPMAVFVSSIKDCKLLYVNDAAQKLLQTSQSHQETACYHAVGFDKPCPFCHTGEMVRSQQWSHEFHHPVSNRIYQIRGEIIDWEEEPAYLEYLLDITERREKGEPSNAQNENLQEVFSSIPCGLSVYKVMNGKISPIFHNPAFYEIMGYSAENIRNVEKETNFLGVHPDDLEALQKKIQDAIKNGSLMQCTYRVWNDRKKEYRWILLEGSVKSKEDESKLLYGVYRDISERVQLENELTETNEKMQDVVHAIPGGVAIYRVSDILEPVYFSDGVAELCGYTAAEYQQLCEQNAAELIYKEDTDMVAAKVREVIKRQSAVDFELRKQHKDGSIIWVRARMKWLGTDKGHPLLHCVFHNISVLKEAQLEMEHLVNSIPGGIASYQVRENRFIPTFFSDGVMELSGHTRAEYEEMLQYDALDIIYEPDRARVLDAAKTALASGEVLDISYRMRHKDGNLIWVHLNGRRMGPLAETMRFYAVFTGMSVETRLFQDIADETADGIYVIDRDSYDLLYANESEELFTKGRNCLGQKCYAALHGKSEPCSFCTLKSCQTGEKEHRMEVDGTDRVYSTRFRETDWNGIPAYIKYVRDITEEVENQREKEKLEEYFQTVVKNLPGGVAVVRYEKNGLMKPEFLSEGFAAMTEMTLDEAWDLYREDALIGVHPEDRGSVTEKIAAYMNGSDNQCEAVYRLKKGDGSYLWVKNTLSMTQNDSSESKRVYAFYHDITQDKKEQERIRLQYQELIMQHYHTQAPNELIAGHCNITKNVIQDIVDYTNSDLLTVLGTDRDRFFTGLSEFIPEPEERSKFLATYLNKPSLEAFARGDLELRMECFMKLPRESRGRYVQIKVNMVATPDSGDITGILTVMDVTEQTIADRILHQLSVTGYDFVADLDLTRDSYRIVSYRENAYCIPPKEGRHSEWAAYMYESKVVPKDKESYRKNFDPQQMLERLKENDSYTFAFSVTDDHGDIRTKNLTVSACDMRLGRVCLARTDITESIREQQGLLRVIAYTFELVGFIDLESGRLTLYTRDTVLENLPPYFVENYDKAMCSFVDKYLIDESKEEGLAQFQTETILSRLKENPTGYDFLFSDRMLDTERYKQVNVLWGDQNHKTVCLVRQDVTDMLAEERQTKKKLEKALLLAEKANQAKTDFLSSMSHDIRTPMNAIMGMTALASAHLGEKDRVEDCLKKIAVSSKHLLSLINDILDMSKIEESKVMLNRVIISLPELIEQLSAIMTPQAEDAGLELVIRTEGICHEYFWGDSLRINQILLNILSNAVKFTPQGGRVEFLAEELEPEEDCSYVRYRFTISDTGVGMTEEFLAHIFDPFTRSNNAARVEGTGLGLSITKNLVDLMEGNISVESQVDQGSRFRVELKCERVREEENAQAKNIREKASAADKETLFAGRRFLVAEDNAINAEILCELLKMYGADFVVKPDGKQAAAAFFEAAAETYDAILMDIQMPEMNGYDAARAIRAMKRPDAKTIPILAMTANAFTEDVKAALDAGMNAHVAKPIDVDMLYKILSELLETV